MIRFNFIGLSPSQRLALSTLIDNGGTAPAPALILAANARIDRTGGGIGVMRSTIRALIRRGHLERQDDGDGVQITPHAAREALRLATNPNPIPVMRARAEALAHREAVAR